MIQALTITQFNELAQSGHYIIDSRNATEFMDGFVPGSLNIGLDGDFRKWSATLIPSASKILMITTVGKEDETARQLMSAGFSEIAGYLEGGFETWKSSGESIDLIISVDPDELAMDIPFDTQLLVVDVRSEIEFEASHLKDALNLPLEEMTDLAELANFEENQNLYMLSGDNYRSTIATSLFKKHGYHNLRQVKGGWYLLSKESRIKIESPKKN